MIFRLSQKLSTKLKAGKLEEATPDANPYADWSCHLFKVGRTEYIIICNTASLYSCVMLGKGITNQQVFADRARSTIHDFLDEAGQPFVHRKFIEPFSETIHLAKALNRSVTGSMNDLIYHAQAWLEQDQFSLHEVGLKLNEVLLSALAEAPKPYGKPNEVFKRLADQF